MVVSRSGSSVRLFSLGSGVFANSHIFLLSSIFSVLSIKSKALCVLSKHPLMELSPNPSVHLGTFFF